MHEGCQVMMVDDIRENIQVLGQILELNGYVVRVATSGAMALESVRKSMPSAAWAPS
jgi:CheY-like chemotaxis protein